jgi:baculoviral IAP repeat-containing protein 7/8
MSLSVPLHRIPRRAIDRLVSFREAKWENSPFGPRDWDLAQAGFYHHHVSLKVVCVFCELEYDKYSQESNIWEFHERRKGNCNFLMGNDVGNVPLSFCPVAFQRQLLVRHVELEISNTDSAETAMKSQNLKLSNDMCELYIRVSTFIDGKCPPQLETRKATLAYEGFFYSNKGDNVTCFSCRVEIGCWDRYKNSATRHAILSPDCKHVLSTLGKAFTKLAPAIELWIKKPIVTQCLDMNLCLLFDLTRLFFQRILSGKQFYCSFESFHRAIEPIKQKVPNVEYPTSTRKAELTNLCNICLTQPINIVFLPCGHAYCCWWCSDEIEDRKCPYCRCLIKSPHKLFIAASS